MILLQHDGLALSQLDNMISYRIPTTWSGRHSNKMALVMLMMFPSTFIAPLASGSIDWRSTQMYKADSRLVRGGFGKDNFDWFFGSHQMKQNKQWKLGLAALGHAIRFWDLSHDDLNRDLEGTYWYIARDEALPSTQVENAPMPFIEVHSITWDDKWADWAENIVFDQRKIRYGGAPDRQTNTLGSGMIFDSNTTLPTSLPDSAKVFEGRKKVAMLASRTPHIHEGNCTAAAALIWDDMEQITLKAERGSFNCYALGTIHFTAGIMYFPIGTYLSNRTVEAKLHSNVETKSRLKGDLWAEYCSKILTELMSTIPIMNGARTEGRNLTKATEILVRQAYLAMRQELGTYVPDPPMLTTRALTSYLEARVDRARVLIWLALNLMVGGAGFIIGLVEQRSKGRQEVASISLAPLMTDVREILVADQNGISDISYLTSTDKKSIKKVRLTPISVPGKTLWGLAEKD